MGRTGKARSKRFVIATVLCALALTLAGCGQAAAFLDKREEVDAYIDRREAWIERYNAILESHDTGFIMEDDPDLMAAALDEGTDAMQSLLRDAESEAVRSDELRAVHESLLNGMRLQLEAFALFERWLAEENDELLAEGDAAIDRANEALTEHEDALVALAERHFIRVLLE